MKMEDRRSRPTIYSIKPGEAFCLDNTWFIKTDKEEPGDVFCCVNLKNGELIGFCGPKYVEKAYDLKVVIE